MRATIRLAKAVMLAKLADTALQVTGGHSHWSPEDLSGASRDKGRPLRLGQWFLVSVSGQPEAEVERFGQTTPSLPQHRLFSGQWGWGGWYLIVPSGREQIAVRFHKG